MFDLFKPKQKEAVKPKTNNTKFVPEAAKFIQSMTSGTAIVKRKPNVDDPKGPMYLRCNPHDPDAVKLGPNEHVWNEDISLACRMSIKHAQLIVAFFMEKAPDIEPELVLSK